MAYTRVNWKDYPSTDTPITAANLNKMDEAIDDMYDIVSNCPVGVDTIETTTAVPRDADTLGGRYDADDIEDLSDSLANVSFDGAGAHNSIYRGKYLGTSVTAEQYARIADGTFKDLYIGDYWTIGDVNYRIASFDYVLNSEEPLCTTHHAVIVPDTCFYKSAMNDTATTSGAYVGSKMYTTNLAQAKTIINNAFSGHVISHRLFLNDSTTNGYASAGNWYDSTVELMTENMVYGCLIYSPTSNGTYGPNNTRVEKTQLRLFALNPSVIGIGNHWWLRDVISTYDFSRVNEWGATSAIGANNECGVRPYFCIKG